MSLSNITCDVCNLHVCRLQFSRVSFANDLNLVEKDGQTLIELSLRRTELHWCEPFIKAEHFVEIWCGIETEAVGYLFA